MKVTSRRSSNPLPLQSLARIIAVSAALGMAGLVYVHLKHQQHGLGDDMRKIERELTELRERNHVLAAKITTLTSRTALHQRLKENFVALIPIEDHAIARFTPPAEDQGQALRTVSNDRLVR